MSAGQLDVVQEGTAIGASPGELASRAAEMLPGPNPYVGWKPSDVLEALEQIGRQVPKQPKLAIEQAAVFAGDLIAILAGKSKLAPAKGDRRFADCAWQTNPFYRATMQSYMAWGNAMKGFVDKSALQGQSKDKAQFALCMLTEALAPMNSLAGNPTAVKRLIDSGGVSLVKGLQHWVEDLRLNRGMPAQVDKSAFELGKNLALTQGAVVFRNDVLELIQYKPITAEVRSRPQLIVPPQINKFYIFDLAPGRSIVEHLLLHGMQTFIVSWRNPTAAQRHWDVDTYVAALIEAIEAIREITGAEDVNLHGACSGALTIAALLGHLAAVQRPLVHSATLMVSVLGLSKDSQLGLFATPETIALAKQGSARRGVLEGQEMARVFAWMRPTDLVWNYWVNNYLLGNDPPAFDILYWNNDTTRLPAAFHSQLLDIFSNRLFTTPGAWKVLGTPIDLKRVACDLFVVGGLTDHITPWRDVYESTRAFGGDVEFVLSSSGHIQSLINPSGNPKAQFFLGRGQSATPEEWMGGARTVTDSWWGHWCEWLAQRSGPMGPAPQALGSGQHMAQSAAPGAFVVEP